MADQNIQPEKNGRPTKKIVGITLAAILVLGTLAYFSFFSSGEGLQGLMQRITTRTSVQQNPGIVEIQAPELQQRTDLRDLSSLQNEPTIRGLDCVEEEKSDLGIKSVSIQDINESKDHKSLEYTFNVEIFNSSVAINEPSVWLSIYNQRQLENIEKYDQIGDGNDAVAIKAVQNNRRNLSMICGGSYTAEITATIPKGAELTNLVFLIDSFNVINEMNEGNDANTFSLYSNNVREYSVGHPYKGYSFGVDSVESEDWLTALVKVYFNPSSTDSATEIKSNSNFQYVVLLVDNIDTSILSEPSEVFYSDFWRFGNGLVETFVPVDTNTKVFGMTETTPLLTGEVNIEPEKNQAIILALETETKTKTSSKSTPNYIPLHGLIRLDATKTVGVDECSMDKPDCLPEDYLLIKTETPLYHDTTPEQTTNTEVIASEFSVCKIGDTPASINGVKVAEYTEFKSGHSLTYTYKLDGENMWDPLTISGTNTGNMNQERDIKLGSTKILNGEDCSTITSAVSNVNNSVLSQFSISALDTPASVYVIGPDNYYHKLGGGYGGVGELVGSTLIYTAEEGVSIAWDNSSEEYEYKYDPTITDFAPFVAAIEFGTKVNQTATIESIDLKITTDLPAPENLQAKIITSPILNWYEYFNNFGTSVFGGSFESIPTNGTISIPVNKTLGYGERLRVLVRIPLPIDYEGKVQAELVSVNSNIDEAQIQKINGKSFHYNKLFYGSPLELPLSNSAIFEIPVGGDGGNPPDGETPPDGTGGTGTSAPYITINAEKTEVPNSIPEWFSAVFAKDLYFIDLRVFTSFPESYGGAITLDPVILDVIGNFADPIQLKAWWTETENEELLYMEAGSPLAINFPEINPQYNPAHTKVTEVRLLINDYPNVDSVLMKQVLKPITAKGKNGEDIKINIFDFNLGKEILFENDYPLAAHLLGKENLYQTSDGNSPVPKLLSISQIQDQEVTMNDSCFIAQGNLTLTEFTYTHKAHDTQPFDKVILSVYGDLIYLPLQGWSPTEAVFKPTEPIKLNHGDSTCLRMEAQSPKEPLNNAFFDLTKITAKIENTTFSAPTTLQSGELLSDSQPVKGTVITFY